MAIYKHIIQDILEQIETEQLKRGEKLPSIRHLSQQYHCSKDTVQKAMLELKHLNKIYSVEKSGYYILEDKQFQEKEIQLEETSFQQLPYDDFRICLNETLVGRENYLFNYYHKQEGLDELLESLHSLLSSYNVYSKKEQIVITSGSQQALYILTQVLKQNQSNILIENPTYPRMRSLLEEQGVPYYSIERTLEGIDLEKLENLFQKENIQFFYTIPRLHNPLETSYTLSEKKEILRLAQKYNVYLIEDDYLADFDAKKQVPLHYLDTMNRVIYIKSFTTTLFPALRIGGVVLPPDLLSNFLHIKSLIDYDTNLIMQKALSLYIDNGMFARNTKLLQEKAFALQEKVKQTITSLAIPVPYQIGKNGVILQLLPEQVKAALKYTSLPVHIVSNSNFTYLILSYSSSFEQDLISLLELLFP